MTTRNDIYMKQAVLSLLVSNHFGVLTRVTNLFSQRGFNIDSLAVGETENPEFSRITITTHGDDGIINQIKLQLAKLEDVKVVYQIWTENLFIREVILIKVSVEESQKDHFLQCVNDYHARLKVIDDGCYIIELTDTPASVDYFIEKMQQFTIKEVCRTGGAALMLSKHTVY